MKLDCLKEMINQQKFKKTFSVLYGKEQVEYQTNRYLEALKSFENSFSMGDDINVNIYSAPGRVEIIGNHTDHQRGKVVAASVNLDVLSVVYGGGDKIRISSDGYEEIIIDISDTTIYESEKNTSESLVRGIVAYFIKNGYKVGGFTAYITSSVLKGSGLSSSAAFETLIGAVLNGEYNDGSISAVEIAKAGQFAENVYFGKPSGLMDQMASSVGNIVAIDFFDANNTKIQRMEMPLDTIEHTLCVVDTGGDHADLTNEYAAIPIEMKDVAGYFNKDVLSQIDEKDFMAKIPELRNAFGDRAVLRAIHFYGENNRVDAFGNGLNNKDFELCFKILKESGASSFQYLQNVFLGTSPKDQGLSIALAIAEKVLSNRGAYRVHGGGFGGTILAIVPNDLLSDFKAQICSVFGKDSCHQMYIRPVGAFSLVSNTQSI